MINSGKKFEKLIQESCKIQGIDCNRLKDAGWQGEETTRRFTSKNICDFTIFDGSRLFYIEAKSRKSSIRFDELTQHKALKKKDSSGYKNVRCGYLIEFSKAGSKYFMSVRDVDFVEGFCGKKSFNEKDIQDYSYKLNIKDALDAA